MTPTGGAPRIGCVKYLNARPLIHGWGEPVVFDHPVALCAKLASGELDAALVSSFEFLRSREYAIIDDVAVAADGPVYSVFLVHAGVVGDLKELVIDPASLTSVNLLRCLLAERGMQPEFVSDVADAPKSITAHRGRLMIGDQAIRFRQREDSGWTFLDLGEEWKRLTGLPFVFALWLIRPEVQQGGELADALRARRDENLRAFDDVIAAQREFDPAFCAHYFRHCLRFHFGEREKAGLSMFQSLCEKHAILPRRSHSLQLV